MSSEHLALIQREFFEQHPPVEGVIALFEHLPQVLFFVKDSAGRFIKANQPFRESIGVDCETQLIGKTARDFHPPLLAEAYMADDQNVMLSGLPKPGEIWLMLHRRREPRWYVETKVPLLAESAKAIGIVGTMYRIEQPHEFKHYLKELTPVALHIERHFAEPISMADMADMADMAGISSTQFNRRFRQLLRMTPMEYLRTVRIQAAQKMLTTTSDSLAQISVAVGYSDQSHFTKRFREITGMTPASYRSRFIE